MRLGQDLGCAMRIAQWIARSSMTAETVRSSPGMVSYAVGHYGSVIKWNHRATGQGSWRRESLTAKKIPANPPTLSLSLSLRRRDATRSSYHSATSWSRVQKRWRRNQTKINKRLREHLERLWDYTPTTEHPHNSLC